MANGPLFSAAIISPWKQPGHSIRSGVDEVTIIYPRPKDEMPAHQRNIADAESEGVKFMDLASPVRDQCNRKQGWILNLSAWNSENLTSGASAIR